ncbi:MAG TPA: hypothetical protein VNK26_04680 [Pyrinomonadaceae bacterium]|nr:hypothetical protein [Pyrinomonadaceae bacterium]
MNKFPTATFLIFILLFVGSGLAQQTAPQAPKLPFVIKRSTEVSEIQQKLATAASNGTFDLVPEKGSQTRIAIFFDFKREGDRFEVHEDSDDIYYVLSGQAELELGGQLIEPAEISPGEWRSPNAKGTSKFTIQKGDLIFVPRGTVHRRTVTEKGFTMVLIKIFARER